jgi:hypothetical protein
MAAMQAISPRRRPRHGARIISHTALIAAVGLIFWDTVAPPPAPREVPVLVGPPRAFPGMPAPPPRDWLPVRVPVRTEIAAEPDLPVRAPADAGPELAAVPSPAHAEHAPEPTAEPAVETRLLVSVGELTVWGGPDRDAPALATVPRRAILEGLGPLRDGRVAVRLGTEGNLLRAWVDADFVSALLNVPRPWERPYAYGVRSVGMDVPYRTQLDGSAAAGANCGPASLGMVLDAFGISVPTDRLRAQAHRFQGTSGPDTGFLLEVLQSVAETYGLEGQDLLEGRRYRRWTLDDVREHLRAGHLVIPQLRYRLMPGREWAGVTYDHYLVLTGVDGDDFFFNDPIPWNGRGQGRITAAQLLRAWQNSDAPMAAVALAGPR